MLIRAKFPRKKPVMVINDHPFKNEVELEEKFSSQANLSLLTALRTLEPRFSTTVKDDTEPNGIHPLDIYATYLSYEIFSTDFSEEFLFAKDVVFSETQQVFVNKNTNLGKFIHIADTNCYMSAQLFAEYTALLEEIRLVEPKIIVITGKWGFFLLTFLTTLASTRSTPKDKKILGGLDKWRASLLQPAASLSLPECILYPMLHTIFCIRMPEKAPIIKLDLLRLGHIYQEVKANGVQKYLQNMELSYVIGDTKEKVFAYLRELQEVLENAPTFVSVDVETMNFSFIDCIGITYETNRGFCVPFASIENPAIFNKTDEIEILLRLREVLSHPNALHVGQNYSYDVQFFFYQYRWKFLPFHDTMVLHHVLWNNRKKDLASLASCFVENYKYWKDEVTAFKETPETRWRYNIKDICYTLEISNVLLQYLEKRPTRQQAFYEFQIRDVVPATLQLMNKGVHIDEGMKEQLNTELSTLLETIDKTIKNFVGFPLNLNSPTQIKKLFVEILEIEPIFDKKSKNATFGSVAMLQYAETYPQYHPFIHLILEYRAVAIYVRTFLSAKTDEDGRMRTSYNVTGTKSYRFSSRKNFRGLGMNFNNIPKKGKIDLEVITQVLMDNEEIEEEGA